jgi:hypothetical protein
LPRTHDIWVCRAHPGADGIRVESLERLLDLPGGVPDGAGAARALVDKIRDAPRSAWGFSAAFGRPGPNPDAAGIAGRPSRRTETDHGLAARPDVAGAWMREGVLQPLAAASHVCVLPLDQLPLVTPGMPAAMVAGAATTYLLEVAPDALATALTSEGVDLHPDAPREALRELTQYGLVRPMARALREQALREGGWSALLCAIAAWRGYRCYDHGALHADAVYAHEGFIYC